MNRSWPEVEQYMNLLKPCTKIETEFMQALQEQELDFSLIRKLGIYRTLSLTSIIGAIHRSTPNEEKEKSYLMTEPRRD